MFANSSYKHDLLVMLPEQAVATQCE